MKSILNRFTTGMNSFEYLTSGLSGLLNCFRLLCAGTLGAVFFGSIAYAQPVSDRVLSRVSVSESNDCAVAAISFNFPVRIKSYFPQESGDHVRIDLQSIEVGRGSGAGLRAREELRAPSNRKAGIQEIQYDGDAPTGPVLTVTFNRDRYFSISQGTDFRSIDITIAESPIEGACRGKKPGLRLGSPFDRFKNKQDATSTLHTTPPSLDENAVYALNLLSQQADIKEDILPDAEPFEKYAAYAVRFEENGVVWNRLRLGFFKTRMEAQATADALKQYYPESWIVRTSQSERAGVYQAWLDQRAAQTVEKVKEGASGGASVADLPENDEAASLVAEARQKMAENDNARAIQLLTKALNLDENQSTPDAQELLGLARQRNGQQAHAKAEYEAYLKRYPNGPGAPRVRQRLSALLTDGKEASPELRETSKGAGEFVKRVSASFSQYYTRDESTVTLEQPDLIPDPDKQVNRNALVTGADLTASISNDRFDASLRYSGSYTNDFMKDGTGDLGSVSAMYVELADSSTRLMARIGRQSRSTGGVLGRFDGGLLSFDASKKLRINVVAGAPVIRSRDLFIDKERRFVGASVDVNQVVEGLDTTVYFIHQTVDDLVDRQAAGFEFRYVDDTKSAFGLIDYDTFYDSLNLALFNGSWRMKDKTTFNVSFDYRYSPTLLTIDALQGQGVETISELRSLFNDEDIYYLAESRAARTTSGSFTVSRPLSEKFQINGGVTLARMGSTIDAGGVMGQPSTGVDAFYSAQLFGQNLIKEGDFATVGIRLDDLSTSRRYVVDFNTRYPFSRKFRISPRLRLSQRDSLVIDQTQFTIKPSIRINYIPTRRYQFEIEGGGEWTDTQNVMDSETINGYYAIAGYRLDF